MRGLAKLSRRRFERSILDCVKSMHKLTSRPPNPKLGVENQNSVAKDGRRAKDSPTEIQTTELKLNTGSVQSTEPTYRQGCWLGRLPFREKKGRSLGRAAGKPLRVMIMSRLTWIQRVYWTRFSKPVSDRELVRQLIDHPIASLLEIGVGRGERMNRISQLVSLTPETERLRYIGVDEFEAAKDGGNHLSLKTAHQLASQLGFKASLIPGDIKSAMPRVAHKFGPSDLIVIDGGLDPQQPHTSAITPWLNRIAHDGSIILACAQPGQTLTLLAREATSQTLRAAA